MKRSGFYLCHLAMWIGLAFALGCSDGYTPPDNIIIEDNNQMGEPAGSAEVLVGFPSGSLLEGGAAVTVSVSLKRPPSAPVTITLASSDEAAGTVSPATLTFEPGAFAAAQVVTLTPVDDEVATGDKKWELRFELASDDAEFNGKPVTSLKLTTIDNDAAPFIVAAATGAPQTTEQGGAATISVQLSKQPTADVLVPITLSDAAEADLDMQSLTFTALSWNLPQQVVVTGKDDRQRDGDKAFKVIFGAANSTDEEFNGIGPAEVALTNIDGVCGNMVVDGAEACEPTGMSGCEFGQMGCMVCNNACELVPGDVTGFCGDGITQSDKGEACDEPTRPCAYGERSCMVCGAQCQRVPGQVTGFCGDGVLQAGSGEQCDGAPTQTCNGNNADQAGTITCSAQCRNDSAQCFSITEQLSLGDEHLCVLLKSGAVYCWGDNNERQLGDPSYNGNGSRTARLIPNLSGLTRISAGAAHTCALFTGTIACWGDGTSGQLGNNDFYIKVSPDAVVGLTNAAQVVAGGDHTCARLSSGQVRCWGGNEEGQLGDGSQDNSATPVVVVGSNGSGQLANVAQLAVGFEFTCALMANGQVLCWGRNDYGQLGIGSSVAQAKPTAVVGIQDAVQIAAGDLYACALLSSGQVKCWGENDHGQLGVSAATLSAETPVVVSALSGVARIELGGESSCALLSSGQIKCWGNNDRGQLGDGTFEDRHTPVLVSGVSGAAQIEVGYRYACALLQSGQVLCWGDNSEGQLLLPVSVEYRQTPVALKL